MLLLNVSGPTKAEAVRRANALANALLGFRADRIQQQTASSDKALQDEVNSLQQQINQLSAAINNPGSPLTSGQLTTLVGKQSGDTSEIATLEQTIQQNQLASIAVTSWEPGRHGRDFGSSLDCEALRARRYCGPHRWTGTWRRLCCRAGRSFGPAAAPR